MEHRRQGSRSQRTRVALLPNRTRTALFSRSTLIAILLASAIPFRAAAQSANASNAPAPFNLVENGSFELVSSGGVDFPPWQWAGGLRIENAGGAADGVMYSGPCTFLAQDLETVPGKAYQLRLASRYRTGINPWMTVFWGSNQVDKLVFPQVGPWAYHTYKVIAQQLTTHLAFFSEPLSSPDLDDVSVILDPDEPVQGSLPTISAIADQTTPKEAPIVVAFTVDDAITPPADLLVLSHSSNTNLVPNANLVCDGTGSNRTLTITPARRQTGWVTITLMIVNRDTNAAYARFGVTVVPTNTPPKISAISDQVTTENQPLDIPFRVADEESPNSLILSAKASDPSLVPGENLSFGYDQSVGYSPYFPHLILLPATNRTGATTITVTATDAGGKTVATVFTLDIRPPSVPRLSPIADQTAARGMPIAIPFELANDAVPVGRLVLNAHSSNQQVVPDSWIWLNLGPNADSDYTTTGTLSLRTMEQSAGSTTITITVTDGSASVSQQFTLTVPWTPAIVTQPTDQMVYPGDPTSFSVVAQSDGPLQYQWRFNGVPIEGATNSTFALSNASPSWQGCFTVFVGTPSGSVVSDPAILQTVERGGAVLFANIDGFYGIDAPVFAADGVTRLAGTRYLAQLYAGPTATNLAPVGPAVPFLTGSNAGYWSWGPNGVRTIPTVAPGDTAYAQVRVWESGIGVTFEQAVAAGGQTAASDVLEVVTGGGGAPPSLPAPLIGLKPLRLDGHAAGLASLPTGGTGLAGVSQASQVELNRLSWDGPVVLSVNNGNAGEVYELQSSSDLTQWSLAATAVSSGRLTRVMVGAPRHAACRFYRAVRLEQ